MPLPEFKHGYLPNPLPNYEATMREIEQRFAHNGPREELWDAFREILTELDALAKPSSVHLNHDFVSEKGVPTRLHVAVPLPKGKAGLFAKFGPHIPEFCKRGVDVLFYCDDALMREQLFGTFERIAPIDESDRKLGPKFRKAYVSVRR